MDKDTFWQLTYVSVLAIQYHPRNCRKKDSVDFNAFHLRASIAADEAAEDYDRNFGPKAPVST